jgi:hypothetical protein
MISTPTRRVRSDLVGSGSVIGGRGRLGVVAGPRPPRHFPQRVKFVIGRSVGVLHRDARAELHMGAHGLAEWLVVGHLRRVERGHVELDESGALLVGDVQASMHVDQVGESQLASEVIGAAERLGGELREVLDVVRLPGAEQRMQEWVGEHARVEDVFQSVQTVVFAGVLIERRHDRKLREALV